MYRKIRPYGDAIDDIAGGGLWMIGIVGVIILAVLLSKK